MAIDPQKRSGVVLLANKDDWEPLAELAQFALELLAKLERP